MRERCWYHVMMILSWKRGLVLTFGRINPIVTVLPARTATEEDNFGDYHIPKGTKVSIYINGLQRSPDLWEEPSRFDPDRFLPELSCKRPTYAWSAFGGGPRVW